MDHRPRALRTPPGRRPPPPGSGTHAHALRQFERAIDLADEYAVLDPWEPTYSLGVVRSNAASAQRDHERAVAVVEETLDELRGQAVPEDRLAEMARHLRGQKQERLALLAGDEPTRLGYLEAALDNYESVGFERSVDRIESKLGEIREAGDGTTVSPAASEGGEQFRGGPRPTIRPDDTTGPSRSDIPGLHDFLTEADTAAVGSADPGVLPDERHAHGPGSDSPGGPPRDDD